MPRPDIVGTPAGFVLKPLALSQIVAGGVYEGVVVVTGQTSSTHRVRASLAGCNGFLTKPLIEADFIDTLCKVDPLFRSEQPTGFG